jgi:type IV secretory pathway VirB10-like protein
MNKEQLLKFIESPANIDKKNLPSLISSIKAYPYCQTLQILLARHLNDVKSNHAESQIQKAFTYAGNREYVYNYIFSPMEDFKTAQSTTQEPIKTTIPPEPPKTTPPPAPQEKKEEAPPTPQPKMASEKDTTPKDIPSPGIKEKEELQAKVDKRVSEIETKPQQEKPEETAKTAESSNDLKSKINQRLKEIEEEKKKKK